MNRVNVDPSIDQYLGRVRASLRGLSPAKADEILLELRSHLLERSASGGAREAIASLGEPETLARQYREDDTLARAECARSPIVLLQSLILLRRGSAMGWLVLFLCATGYAWAIALAAAAVEKILSPRDVGLWIGPGFPRLTVDGATPQGFHEVLGWWMVPFGLAMCVLLLGVTRQFGLWWIRRRK